jgi:NAD-dependent dihydropyrimidine dehydrogenase PreA subunit
MIKTIFPTLARVRFTVQIATLFLTVWGSVVLGNYAADKISTALPALSCAFDQKNGGYCVLIPLQHQLDHRIGMALQQAGTVTLQVVLPTIIALGTFFIAFFLLGKAFCGWVCPLGTLQEWLNKIGRRFGRPLQRFNPGNVGRIRPAKWLILLGLVIVLPLLSGLGVTPHELGSPYCAICPSRIATTLLTGSSAELAVKEDSAWSFGLNAIGSTLFGFILVAAFAMRQPFCRICPMLAMNGMFRRTSPARLVKVPHSSCEKCGICHDACPMDIHEIHIHHGRKAYHEDCTLCGRCAEYCPQDGVIQLKWGPFALFSSSREYYKNRVKGELPDGTVKPVKFVKNAAKAADA